MTDTAQLKRRYTRRTASLKRFYRRLQVLHFPPGNWAVYHLPRGPHLSRDWESVEGFIKDSMSEADAGCEIASRWLSKTAEVRANIDRLRHLPLPPVDHSQPFPRSGLFYHWSESDVSLRRMHELHAESERRRVELRAELQAQAVAKAVARIDGLQRARERDFGIEPGSLHEYFEPHREAARERPYLYIGAEMPHIRIPRERSP